MEVNFTLLIQGLQFFCAYGFLYKYFFTPVYEVIVVKEQYALRLIQELEKQKMMQQNLLSDFAQQKLQAQKILFQELVELQPQIEDKVTHYGVSDEKQVVFAAEDVRHIEFFLINHLSEVVKK